MMKLYHITIATNDDSSGCIGDFIVAHSEDEAENKWLQKHRGSGYGKSHIIATPVEVDGYIIHVTPIE